MAATNDYNFDHPGAFDFELLVATLRKLKQGKSVKIPVYDFTTHKRQKDWVSCLASSVMILSKTFKETFKCYRCILSVWKLNKTVMKHSVFLWIKAENIL